MEQWENDGFASKEAWTQNMLKRVSDAEEAQRVAEGALKEYKEKPLVEPVKEPVKEPIVEPVKEPVKEPAKEPTVRTDEEVATSNSGRIASLKEEDRKALEDEYEKGTTEQIALLSTPRGIEAYLEMRHPGSVASTNPFAKKEPVVSIEDRINAVFGNNQQKQSPARKELGSGFVLSDKAKENTIKVEDTIRESRDALLR